MTPSAIIALLILAAPCTQTAAVSEGVVASCSGELSPPGDAQRLLGWRERALVAEADLRAALAREAASGAACEARVTKWMSHARDMAGLAREPIIAHRGMPWWGTAIVCGGAFLGGVLAGD